MRRLAADRPNKSVVRLTIPVVDLRLGYSRSVPTMLARRHLVVIERCYQLRSLGVTEGPGNLRGARLPRRQSAATTWTRSPLSAKPESGSGFQKIEDPAHPNQYHAFGRKRPL
jgi:hypothetical protein